MKKRQKGRTSGFRLTNEVSRRMLFLYFGIYFVILALLIALLAGPLYRNADKQARNVLETVADEFETVQSSLSGFTSFLDGELASYLKEYDQDPSETAAAKIELQLSSFVANQEQILTASLEDFDHNFFCANYFQNVVSQEWTGKDTHYQKLFQYDYANYYTFYDNDVFTAATSPTTTSYYYAMSYTKIQYFNQKPYLLTVYYNMNTVMNHCSAFFEDWFTNFAIYSQEDGVLYTEGTMFETNRGDIAKLFGYTRSSDGRWGSIGRYYYVMDASSGWIFVVYSPCSLLFSDALIILGIIMGLYLISPLLYTLLLYPTLNHSLAPLHHLYDVMKQYTVGDPQPPIQIKTGNEIEELGEIYNEMTAKIDQQIQDIKTRERINAETNYKLSATQIDPHFIYNTMNIINIMARQGKTDEIVEINSALIKILRERLSTKLDIMTTLEKELDSLYQYQKIMQYRYGSQVQLLVDVDEALLEKKFPKNIFQPLAENSFYHGFSNLKEGEEGRIELLIYSVEEQIVIELSDDGEGISPKRVKLLMERSDEIYRDEKAHIGLDNIRQRLDYVYGDSYQFEIHSTEGYGTTVSITIPIEADLPVDEARH